jgi:hypothetical protein
VKHCATEASGIAAEVGALAAALLQRVLPASSCVAVPGSILHWSNRKPLEEHRPAQLAAAADCPPGLLHRPWHVSAGSSCCCAPRLQLHLPVQTRVLVGVAG